MDNPILSALGFAGDVLGTPGSVVRGLMAGDPGRAFGGVFDPSRRVHGRELLEKLGVLDENEDGLDPGDVAGFGADVITDPLTYLGGFGAHRAFKGPKPSSYTAPATREVGTQAAREMFEDANPMLHALGLPRDAHVVEPGLGSVMDDVATKLRSRPMSAQGVTLEDVVNQPGFLKFPEGAASAGGSPSVPRGFEEGLRQAGVRDAGRMAGRQAALSPVDDVLRQHNVPETYIASLKKAADSREYGPYSQYYRDHARGLKQFGVPEEVIDSLPNALDETGMRLDRSFRDIMRRSDDSLQQTQRILRPMEASVSASQDYNMSKQVLHDLLEERGLLTPGMGANRELPELLYRGNVPAWERDLAAFMDTQVARDSPYRLAMGIPNEVPEDVAKMLAAHNSRKNDLIDALYRAVDRNDYVSFEHGDMARRLADSSMEFPDISIVKGMAPRRPHNQFNEENQAYAALRMLADAARGF